MEPLERLSFFIKEMLEWEVSFDSQRRLLKGRSVDPVFMQNLVGDARRRVFDIFQKNLSEAALKSRALSRLDTLSTARPPAFAQEIIPIVEKRGRFFYIETINERDVVRRRRYAMFVENGDAKVDRLYVWYESLGKWKSQESI